MVDVSEPSVKIKLNEGTVGEWKKTIFFLIL